MQPAEGFHSEEVRQETLHTLSLVEPFLRADDTIVDVGTGSGYVAWQLGLRRPGKVTAVDVGDFRRAPVERFQIVDGAKLPFPDDTFDVALLAFVLHHVPNESKPDLLREVLRAARRCVILEDTPRNFIDRFFSRRHAEEFRARVGSDVGYGFYDQRGWEGLLGLLGWRLVESRRLSRFCRAWDAPFARSLFVVDRR